MLRRQLGFRSAAMALATSIVLLALPMAAYGQTISPKGSDVVAGVYGGVTSTVPIGGGGWPYSYTATGACGTATISGNPLTGGKAQLVAQLYSFQGNIVGSPTGVDIDWHNLSTGAEGNFFFYPSGSSPDWVSSIVTADTGAGTVEVLLSGEVDTASGSPCEIEFPTIEFPVS